MNPQYDFELGPMVAIWEVTRACELACVHCRATAQPARSPYELTTGEGFQLIDDIARFEPRPIFILTGGDPLMRDDVYPLIAHAVGRGLRTSIAPSVTRHLTADAIERLKHSGIGRIGISLDGACPRTHDAFRGVIGSHRMTMQALADIREAGLPIQLQTTVSRYNLHELPEMGEMAGEIGAVLWNLFFLVPTGRGRKEDMISAEDHEQVFRWLLRYSEETGLPVKTTEAPHYRRVAAEGGGPGRAPTSVNDGKGFCFISHIGDVYPSGFLPVAAGNVRQKTIGEIYRESSLFRKLRNPDLLQGKCGICQYRWVCGGSRARAYAVTGNYLAEEPCCAYDPISGRRRCG